MVTTLKVILRLCKIFVRRGLLIQNRFRLATVQARRNLEIGRGVRIVPLSHFECGENVTIADGAVLDCGGQVWCNYKGGIKIGNNSYIGYNAVLLGGG
ncbi:MAG: hypothetical protein ONB27_07925, partial [candidate division KSB1 bacterium]|nr:hypothetical protein [candidate division KSB1 bacterium]